MSGLFGTTAGPWEIDRMGDIVSGPLNACIPYATRKEDKRAIAQVPAMLELVAAVAKIPRIRLVNMLGDVIDGTENDADAIIDMARAIVAELEKN